jgi:hypothetical protein
MAAVAALQPFEEFRRPMAFQEKRFGTASGGKRDARRGPPADRADERRLRERRVGLRGSDDEQPCRDQHAGESGREVIQRPENEIQMYFTEPRTSRSTSRANTFGAAAVTAILWLCVPHQISAESPAVDTDAIAFSGSICA